MRSKLLIGTAAALLTCATVRPDVIDCENGDRLHGKVISLSETELKLQNDIHGILTIPRTKIAAIYFKAVPPPTKQTTSAGPVQTGVATNEAIKQVQNDLLAGASPEAQQMYRELVSGFLSGNLDIQDIRGQAEAALNDMEALQKELGDDETTALLDSYGAILRNFLNQVPPGTNQTTRPNQPQLKTEEP